MSQRSPMNKRNMPKTEEEKAAASTGMARKSAASAKPARAAASSVRVVTVKKDKDGFTQTSGMTKEEKKAFKKAQRKEDDEVAGLVDLVTKSNAAYKRALHIWWIIMGCGFAFTIVSFVISYVQNSMGQDSFSFSSPLGILSITTLVLAYAFIVGALIWQFNKLRPIRNKTEEKIRAMSPKHRVALAEECQQVLAEQKAAKSSNKAAK